MSSAREMLGLVACRTAARFEAHGEGIRATFDLDHRVRGGAIGRWLDGWVGDEIAGRFRKDADGLRWLAEGTPAV